MCSFLLPPIRNTLLYHLNNILNRGIAVILQPLPDYPHKPLNKEGHRISSIWRRDPETVQNRDEDIAKHPLIGIIYAKHGCFFMAVRKRR